MSLRWAVTRWEGKATNPDDGCAWDGDRIVGRVYRHPHGPQKGLWRWSMTAHVRRPAEIMPISGEEPTKEAAKAAVQACYEKAKAQGIVGPKPKGQAPGVAEHGS